MFNRFEIIVGALCVIGMAAAVFLVQERLNVAAPEQTEQVAQAPQPGIVVVQEGQTETEARREAFATAINDDGELSRLVVDDIRAGTGVAVTNGDTVLVHYAGTLQNGYLFDDSRERGTPFEFTVGAGEVIQGWEEGIVGMREGGERILVVPPDKGYGNNAVGPIPADSTLVFNIQLLEVR